MFIRNYDVWIYALLLVAAIVGGAIVGGAVNYSIGKWTGPKVFHYESSRLFNKDHLLKAHAFYEKYGGRAIILAPFVAGVGAMTYSKFAIYNVTGAILWVGIFLGGGYYFGGLEIVQKNMKLVILGIIIVSVLPIIWEIAKAQLEKRCPPAA